MNRDMKPSQENMKNNSLSSKSVLVIDTPESCEECPLRSYSNLQLMCTPMREGASDVRCPLRPLPEQMTWGHTADYIYGWNDCLDEILGETE